MTDVSANGPAVSADEVEGVVMFRCPELADVLDRMLHDRDFDEEELDGSFEFVPVE